MKKIKYIVMLAATAGISTIAIKHVKRKIQSAELNTSRLSKYYDILLDWIDNLYGKRKLESVFLKKNYKKIAVYGRGTLGLLLYEELKDADIEIKYYIDQNADKYSSDIDGIPTLGIEAVNQMEAIDCIVVTPIHVYENIKDSLESTGVTIPILSLQEVIVEAE